MPERDLAEEKEQLREDVLALPVEYQRRIMEAVRRLTQTFARMSGTDLTRPLPPNVIRLPKS